MLAVVQSKNRGRIADLTGAGVAIAACHEGAA
jgi:hypothetical protein